MQQRQLGKPGSLEFDEQALNLCIAQVTQGRQAALEDPPPLFEGSTRGYALQQNELGKQSPRRHAQFMDTFLGEFLPALPQLKNGRI